MKIWKYRLTRVQPKTRHTMPRGARIISADTQRGTVTIWAVVDPSAETVTRTIAMYGTGPDLPDDPGEFIASVLQGPFVWHLFDEGESW